jgi:hypothetical protein
MFRHRSLALDWNRIESLDVDRIIAESDLGTLQGLIDSLTFSDITVTDIKKGTDETLLNFIRVSQLMLEYLLVGQEQQCGVIENLHYKYTTLKRKCTKLETANVRLREDLAVYQSELLLMHKLHGGKAEAGGGNRALVNTNVKLSSVDQIDGTNDETRRVQAPKAIKVASNYSRPTSEAKLVGGSAKVGDSLKNAAHNPADGDNCNSSDESDDEPPAEIKDYPSAVVSSEHTLSHAEIDLRLHIARLFEQQRELIIQNVVRKEDAILLNEAAAENSAKQRDIFLKQLSERVDGLTRYMQQAVEAMSQLNPVSSTSSAGSHTILKSANVGTASPFRKKSRGTPDTSIDVSARAAVPEDISAEPFVVEGGDSLVEAALAHINKPTATSKPSRAAATNDSDILATSAGNADVEDDSGGADDGAYEESVRHEQVRQRNYALTRRASDLDKREQELASREARVRLMEQAVVSSATKIEKQRDELEVSKLKAALFKDTQTPEKKKDVSVGTVQEPAGSNISMSTSTELEWVLSPSPEKQKRSPVKPNGKEKVVSTPEAISIAKVEIDVQKPPPKQPRKLPESQIGVSMATSTTSLETLKAQEKEAAVKSSIEAERQRQRDLGAKIIRTHVKNAKKFVINRGFRKWLDHTVDKREAENYHREFEAERSAEVARALLAQKREKEKLLESQLKAEREEQREKEKLLENQLRAEREELRRKDEEMHLRLAAERAKEKERYDALLAEGEKEKAELLAAKEKEAADEIRRQAEALLLHKREEDLLEKAREEKAAAEQLARSGSGGPMKDRKPIASQDFANLSPDISLATTSKPAKPDRPTGSPKLKPDKLAKPSIDTPVFVESAADEVAKPSKPAKKASLLSKSADSDVMANASTPLKNISAGKQIQGGDLNAEVAFECVFEHGAHVRDSPSRNARNIGAIDKGQVASGTGRVRVEADGGLMYVELSPNSDRPQGGWVPVTTKGGKPVVKEVTPAAAQVLRYKCVFEHGAFVRDVPSRNAKNIGEIDMDQIVVATGRVASEEVENGVTFIEILASSAHSQGGWVPLTSKAGHTVMEQFIGALDRIGNEDFAAPLPAESAAVDDQDVVALLEDLEDISDDKDLWEKAQARINFASSSGKGA